MFRKVRKNVQAALILMVGLLACAQAATNIPAKTETGSWKDGAYPGYARGHHGQVQVAVVVCNGRIDRVEVVRHKEKKSKEMNAVARKIIEKQSVQVDAVSGATVSSKAVMRAVENALK